jgi:hypothetical protein
MLEAAAQARALAWGGFQQDLHAIAGPSFCPWGLCWLFVQANLESDVPLVACPAR